jgi:hypothetical protein
MMVACKICKAQFQGEGTQGHGCAASVYQKDGHWFVQGHYGSRLFDTNIYKFIGDSDSWQPSPKEPMDPVCDICISVWLRLERLIWVRDRVL